MFKWFKQLGLKEKKLFLLIVIAALFFSSAIPLAGWLLSGSDFYPGRTYITGADKMVYLSQIEEVRQGSFLIHNLYTSEPQVGYFSPLWLVLGIFSRLSQLPSLIVFNLFRLILGVGLIFFAYYLICKIFAELKWRLGALGVLLFSSGVGVLTVFRPWNGENLQHFGSDIWWCEGNTFLTLTHSPLFIVSQVFLLAIFIWVINRLAHAKFLETSIVGLAVLFLGLMHPYDLFIVFPVLAVWWLIKALKEKKWLWVEFFKLTYLFIFALMALAYFFYLKEVSAGFAGWAEQNITLSGNIVNYLIGYGLLIPFFLLGLRQALKSKNKYLFFLAIWSIVAWFLLFIPLQFQRRLGNGLHIPLAIIAVYGSSWLWPKINGIVLVNWLKKTRITWLILATIAFILINSNLFFVGVDLFFQKAYRDYFYLTPLETQSFDWLKNNLNKDSVILSAGLTSITLPAFTGRFVYSGHGHQTNNWLVKKYMVQQWFFKSNNQDEKKYSWLKQENIDYVYFGLNEKTLGSFNPFAKTYLSLIWQGGEVMIFKVK